MKTLTVNKSWLNDNSNRLDAKPYLSEGRISKLRISKSPLGFNILKNLTNDIFNGPRFKRYYVDDIDRGVPFMGSSDMLKSDLANLKLISKKYSNNLEKLALKKNWILVSCSGTIGNTIFTNEDFENKTASQHIMRIIPAEDKVLSGYLYAYLSSKYGYNLLTQGTYGAVIQHIEPHHIEDLPVPILPEDKQQQIHQLIVDSANLRVQANKLLKEVRQGLLNELNLRELTSEDYEYFGNHAQNRKVSTFKVNSNNITFTTINAFNYSRRLNKIEEIIKNKDFLPLEKCLIENGYFSTGSFKRLEINSQNGIRLINQSDIFNSRKVGKILSRRAVGNVKLVEYGEVLIAGVGTLGEGETFCRVIFGNEELENQLVSGEFIRLKTNNIIPSGYLYAWLSSEYGFRLIRSTQSGTKLCRPIPDLLKNIPIPLLSNERMSFIDEQIKMAHTDLFEALNKENQAINLIEKEIDAWQ